MSSTNNASGVRNLRAMFENKASTDHSTSPPSRGRSPLDTENSENTRPLSKVRASFVAVEKPGHPGQPPQWGLRKASDVSSVSGGIITEESSLRRITSRNSAMAADQVSREDLGHILKGSPFENDKATRSGQAESLGQPSSLKKAQKKIPEINTKENAPNQEKVASATLKVKSPGITKPKSSAATSTAPLKVPAAKHSVPKPAEKSPISPQSPYSAKINTTHPVASVKGIRGGPAKIMAVMDSANRARIERDKKSPIEAKPSQVEKKDQPTVSDTNSIKKDPTSPGEEKAPKPTALPTKLPAVAAATTAASVGRTDGPPKPLNTDNRRVSALRKDKPAPKVASTSTASSLAKKTPRNSLAPQTNGHERPKSRVSTAKDESFLARMMRPTASSQQKIHEKMVKPESPPRVRKVSDHVRQSLGPTKEEDNKENEAGAIPEAAKSIPEREEQKTELPAESAVAQDVT